MKIIFSFLLLLSTITNGQPGQCNAEISLLTVSPGDELYSTFGHSALRVHDTVSNVDIIYNYGTFNFDEPGFYTKFVRGKLMYYLSTDDFNSFIESNREENRTTYEQVLNLSCAEKQIVLSRLKSNLENGNRFYKYDFLFDNCTTRLRDLIDMPGVHFGQVLHYNTSFRTLLYEYLNYTHKQWSKLGIDLLLGSRTDAIMKQREVMFLPDYLMRTFDSSKVDDQPLVKEKQSLYTIQPLMDDKYNLSNPLFIFICLFVVIAFLSFSKNRTVQHLLWNFDTFMIFITGALGLLFLFMWMGTDHLMCKDNYNLLWAWPTNVVAAFFIHSQKKYYHIYFMAYAILLGCLLLFWFIIPQHFNSALFPIWLILFMRSILNNVKKKYHLWQK